MAKHKDDKSGRQDSGRAKKDSGKHKKPASSGKVKKATPPPPPEPDEEDFVGADDPAAEFLDTAAKSTPWWAMSLAFHGLVLACLPLVIFASTIVHDDHATIIIGRRPAQTRQVDLGEHPRGITNQVGMVAADHPITDDPRIDFPGAEESDHNESANEMDLHSMQGQSLDARSSIEGTDDSLRGRQPGMGSGNNEVMGPGGGSGSAKRYGTRGGGGRHNLVARGHGTPATESAVDAGLRWLARHQSSDGHWDAMNYTHECTHGTCTGCGYTSDFDVGLTGLSLLAFLGQGVTPQQRTTILDPATGQTLRYGEVVRKGIAWIISKQNSDGAIGSLLGEGMYNQAIATLALCEAYGMTNAVAYRSPAQKAINFLSIAQNYGLGWRYTPKCGDNDTSVTGWCVMALKSAQISGLNVPGVAFEGARAWINRVTDASGQVGYDRLGSGEIYTPGRNEKWMHHQSMSAVGLLCRIFIDKKKGDPVMAKEAAILTQDLPRWDPQAARPTVDFYYWYYSTLALFQFDGPNGATWQKWNNAMKTALCEHQHVTKDGCLDGSWDTNEVDRWAYAGGRVYGTAINVLTLEVYYRYASVFGQEEH